MVSNPSRHVFRCQVRILDPQMLTGIEEIVPRVELIPLVGVQQMRA